MQVLSHKNDTTPAHAAAEAMQRSGKAKAHREMVLSVLRKQQGLTGPEIGQLSGLGHIEAQRRISDLKNAGLVEYRGKKQCPIKRKELSAVFLTRPGDWVAA